MNVYFETSAFFKLIIDEDGSAEAVELWDVAHRAIASRLTYPEARAALAAAVRAGRVTKAELRLVRSRLESRWDQLEIVEVDDEIARASGDLAEAHALRGYDAVHLACAVALADESSILATWDHELREASARLGLRLAPAAI
ncbi:MAG: type II toxin-antitoxin system VapC family toxin [Actinomycetota bacterium]|nr:type II toxin-antitoxin system VapC family toxin [Actinomycetota bacterium]